MVSTIIYVRRQSDSPDCLIMMRTSAILVAMVCGFQHSLAMLGGEGPLLWANDCSNGTSRPDYACKSVCSSLYQVYFAHAYSFSSFSYLIITIGVRRGAAELYGRSFPYGVRHSFLRPNDKMACSIHQLLLWYRVSLKFLPKYSGVAHTELPFTV